MSGSDKILPLAVVGEGYRSARAQPALTAVLAVVVGAVVAAILTTTGQTAAAERSVLARIESAGSRTIELNSTAGALRSSMLPVMMGLEHAEWVIGLGLPSDGRNAALQGDGQPVTVWPLYGRLPAELVQLPTRETASGEVVLASDMRETWQGDQPVGAMTLPGQQQVPVVGSYEATGPLSFLNQGALLLRPVSPDAEITRVVVAADAARNVAVLTEALLGIVASTDPNAVRVSTPVGLAQLQATVGGDFGQFGRDLLAALLVAGQVLVGLCVLGNVLMRRRDLGRRRALGATRTTMIWLVLIQTGIAASLGVALGVIGGLATAARSEGGMPGAAFVAGVCVLALLGALLAALPAAVSAAFRDPLTVLRTP